MATIYCLLVNLIRFLGNVYRRALKRPPEFIWLDITGSLPEFEPERKGLRARISSGFAGRSQAPSLESLRERLDLIADDSRVRGVVLRVQGLDSGAGWASLEELQRELERFRARGKRVISYVVEPDTRAYYLACAAGEIFAPPLATVGVVGLGTRVNFLKDGLRRAGIEAEVLAVSPYKSAGELFTRNDFSDEAREQTERLVGNRFAELVDAISRSRKLSPEEVRDRIDRAPYDADFAVEEGLLDGACYEDELADKLGGSGERARLSEWGAARRTLQKPYKRRERRRVGLVRLSGTITRGQSRRLPVPLPLVGGEQAGSDSVVSALRAAEKSRRISSILFHVDSRGGDALASDLIWREVERIRSKKPVVVLMGDAAASGGYYVAAPANHIIARRSTVTGSIGVVVTRPVLSGLYGKLGVNPVSVERGARAGLFDTTRRPSKDELDVLESQMQHFYTGFRDRVVRGREISAPDLEKIAGGRVWTGVEALENGLIDETGGFRTAVAHARRLGDLGGEYGPVVKVSPPKGGRLTPGEPAHEVIGVVRDGLDAFADLRATRTWAVSPYEASGGW